MKKDIVVLYHGNCSDGFGGAWAAWKKFGGRADYIGLIHREPPPKNLQNKTIYFVDFVYPKKIMRKIVKDARAVIALDHHLSASEDIKLVDDYIYNTKHSGAAIAWRYFHPQKKVPRLVQYLEDRDLWKFKLPHTKEISMAIDLVKMDFNNWDKLAKDLEKSRIRKKYVERGQLLFRYEEGLIKELVKLNAHEVEFCGHKILAANAPTFFSSKLGHALYSKKPPLSLVWTRMGDKIKVSLRSNGKVDVSKLAAKYGGGGHKAAAGFALKINQKLPWRAIK